MTCGNKKLSFNVWPYMQNNVNLMKVGKLFDNNGEICIGANA
jgi:hypothetical protein